MRALHEIATRLWQTRATVNEMQRRRDQGIQQGGSGLSHVESSRLLAFKSALHLLAWVLEIDLEQLDATPLLAFEEYPQQVMAHRVEIESTVGKGARCLWLVELPAHRDLLDDGFSTEYQAFFLADEQARALYAALGEALPALDAGDGWRNGLGDLPVVCTLPQLRPTPQRSIPSLQPMLSLPTRPPTRPATQPATQPATSQVTRPAPKPRPPRRPVVRPMPDSDGLGYGDWGA